MTYQRLELGIYGVNCYVLKGDGQTVLIDPGADRSAIEAAGGGDADQVILTHGHFDHIYETPYFRDGGAEVLIHAADAPFLQNRALYDPYGMFSEFEDRDYRADALLADNQTLRLCGTDFTVLHTPGHTPGCICLYGDGVLFCGDLLFRLSIGRTDFPGSDPDAMRSSLLRLYDLDPDTRVCPGHGEETTLKLEFLQNPFLKG